MNNKPTAAQLAIKPGDLLDVTQDDGTVTQTTARSEPWQLGHGEWVVQLKGRSGGYQLTRCQPVSEKPSEEDIAEALERR